MLFINVLFLFATGKVRRVIFICLDVDMDAAAVISSTVSFDIFCSDFLTYLFVVIFAGVIVGLPSTLTGQD